MKRIKMIPSKISSSYAKGFFLVLKTHDQKFIEKVFNDFEVILGILGNKDSDIYKKFNSPLMSTEEKVSIISTIFSNKTEQLLIDFIIILINNGRFDHVYEIYNSCLLLRDEDNGLVRGEINVAKKPDKQRQEEIIKTVSSIIGKKIDAEFVEDESVMAGFTTLMGTHYIDYSLASHLRQMETELNRS